MATERRRLLLVDDEEDIRITMRAVLKRAGYNVTAVSGGEAALQAVREHRFPVVITDLRMPGMTGDELVQRLRAEYDEVGIVVMTGHGSVDHAVEMMQNGVADYLTKPVNADELVFRLNRLFETRHLAEENTALKEQVRASGGKREILGQATEMQNVLALVDKVAGTDATVLITGESGVGKELVAQAIHDRSARHGGPFVKVSCAALPETLLEVELFGAEEGAYTDARRQRIGRFELAHGGTLFLDEIGDISPTVQIKLLRVLQEREFERVGGNDTIAVDVRLISATNQNLRDPNRDPVFREDLYYRLNVVNITVPPLRERVSDVCLLAETFLARSAREMSRPVRRISPAALERLRTYPWPGNVRELENAIERAVVLSDGETLDTEDFAFLEPFRSVEIEAPLQDETLEAVERSHIRRVLSLCSGNRTQAAERLGIHRETLYNKIRRYGLE
ncbi:MAG: sigma-54-dependent Fis family transcriptional regulator [Fimbriimonadaceae bacterium]|nr:sigma-54-dependent Fis family transcriptional regulator [Fimbriimonadaceae bacterium]